MPPPNAKSTITATITPAVASLTLSLTLVAGGLAGGCAREDATQSGPAQLGESTFVAADSHTGDPVDDLDTAPDAMPDLATDPVPDVDVVPPPDLTLPPLDLGERLTVAGCDTVTVSEPGNAEVADLTWRIAGRHGVHLTRLDDGGVEWRAPVVNRPTVLVVHATGDDDEGRPRAGSLEVEVTPASQGDGLAPGMAWDCAPFTTGVASGDPDADSVWLWSRIEAEEDTALSWVLARDVYLDDVVATGSVTASVENDYTVRVQATGLEAGTTYYYRFATAAGAVSELGRTRTTPAADADTLRLATMSCASLFSGYFNAYARIAEREELDLVVHLGDYLYDFVDEEEEVRLPDEYPIEPSNQAEWRERHRFYLGDPDLRAARAAHPWVVLWDNHDIERDPADADERTLEAFREYVPIRPAPEGSADPTRQLWRTISLGALADLTIVDIYANHLDDTSLLSDAQWADLEGVVRDGSAPWHIFGNQELLTPLLFPEVAGFDGVSDWDEVVGERERFFALLAERDDNVVLSGDLHFTIAADVVLSPDDPLYDPESDDRSVGVELLAAGISRGNFDETLCRGLCNPTLSNLVTAIREELDSLNPHARFFDLIEHGYGVLTVTDERITAEMLYSPIREVVGEERVGATLVVERGANRWSRE